MVKKVATSPAAVASTSAGVAPGPESVHSKTSSSVSQESLTSATGLSPRAKQDPMGLKEGLRARAAVLPAEAPRGALVSGAYLDFALMRQETERHAELRDLRLGRAGSEALSTADRQLAPYLLGRALDDRPIEGPQLDVLRRANDSVEETRELFVVGRGNVKPDLKASGHASERLVEAMRDTLKPLILDPKEPMSPAVEAGVNAFVGAGYCGEHASVSSHVHAARLKPGEEVLEMRHKRRDHSFSQTKGAGLTANEDAWCEGPAIDAPDGTYSKNPRDLEEIGKITSRRAAWASLQFRLGKEVTGPELKPKIDEKYARLEKKGHSFDSLFALNPRSGIRKSFAKRVKAELKSVTTPEGEKIRLSGGKRERLKLAQLGVKAKVSDKARDLLALLPQLRQQARLRNEIMATHAARVLGAGVTEATGLTAEIIDGAKNLRRPGPPRGQPLNASPADASAASQHSDEASVRPGSAEGDDPFSSNEAGPSTPHRS